MLADFFGQYKISITDENDKELADPIKYLQDRKILAKIKAFSIATNFNFELSDEQKLNILNNFQINDLIIKKWRKMKNVIFVLSLI